MARSSHLSLKLLLAALVLASIALAKQAAEGPVLSSQIEQCEPLKRLQAIADESEEHASNTMRRFFDFLFPFDSPGKNAVLATFYISSVPNILLAFIPSEISPSTMNIMTAFAAGGLLSDVFVHLIPHSFMGGEEHGGVQFILVEEKRNVLIGLSVFLGFAFFYATEKLSRTFGGGDDHEHGHSHSHSHSHSHEVKPSGVSSSVEKTSASDELRKRGTTGTNEAADGTPAENNHTPPSVSNGPSKLSAYLNLMGDFMHNITDGLVIAASFYSSPLIGATSTLACFAHEIPHEIADFSILVRSGFTKRQAMGSQFITAIGAFCGTFLGIAIEQAAASSSSHGSSSHDVDLSAAVRGTASGILGTTVQPSELVIPAIAGGFIYIATVAVVPVLLQENRGFKQAMKEFGAMGFGVACMVLVAWNE